MRVLIVAFALIISQCYGKTCGVYDGEGNLLGGDPHRMGSIGREAKPGIALPGELRFENVRLISVETGNCDVTADSEGNRLRFKSIGEMGNENVCTLNLSVRADAECPATTPNVYTVQYHVEDGGKFHGFVRESYTYQPTFPVARGAKLSDEDVEVFGLAFSTRIELEEDFDGVEVVPIEASLDGVQRFEVRATRELYLLEDLNLTMVAKGDGLRSKARLAILVNENSTLPQPQFEKSFYVVRLSAFDLDSNREIHPSGMIRLKDYYGHISFDLRSLNDHELEFALKNESDRTVDVRLVRAPENFYSQEAVLHLTARITDQFGRRREGFTTLLVEVEGNEKCFDPENKEHLVIALIVLSVVVVILLLVIMFLYFTYVCVKKPDPATPCKKCSAPAAVKTRRPTPRKISEYPYPLDVMPPPLETLAEVDAEEAGEVKPLEIKVTAPKDESRPIPSTSGLKTRKRSMTFRESDEEARQYREASPITEVAVHQPERKTSNESQRRISVEEERRRRKSSVKMYRCLT